MNPNNNFDPSTDLVREDECDTLLLYLPGFTKENLRVQLTALGNLKISGRSQLPDGTVRSFVKECQISKSCDKEKISAKFEGGILYIRQPKVQTPAPVPSPAPAPAPKTESAPPPAPAEASDGGEKADEKLGEDKDKGKEAKKEESVESKRSGEGEVAGGRVVGAAKVKRTVVLVVFLLVVAVSIYVAKLSSLWPAPAPAEDQFGSL